MLNRMKDDTQKKDEPPIAKSPLPVASPPPNDLIVIDMQKNMFNNQQSLLKNKKSN